MDGIARIGYGALINFDDISRYITYKSTLDLLLSMPTYMNSVIGQREELIAELDRRIDAGEDGDYYEVEDLLSQFSRSTVILIVAALDKEFGHYNAIQYAVSDSEPVACLILNFPYAPWDEFCPQPKKTRAEVNAIFRKVLGTIIPGRRVMIDYIWNDDTDYKWIGWESPMCIGYGALIQVDAWDQMNGEGVGMLSKYFPKAFNDKEVDPAMLDRLSHMTSEYDIEMELNKIGVDFNEMLCDVFSTVLGVSFNCFMDESNDITYFYIVPPKAIWDDTNPRFHTLTKAEVTECFDSVFDMIFGFDYHNSCIGYDRIYQ